MEPLPGEVEEAKRHPNGWVYRIEGEFASNDAVPPEAVVGAWKVDADGRIVGEFVPNSKFVSDEVEHEKAEDTTRDKIALWLTVAIALAVAAWIVVRFIK